MAGDRRCAVSLIITMPKHTWLDPEKARELFNDLKKRSCRFVVDLVACLCLLSVVALVHAGALFTSYYLINVGVELITNADKEVSDGRRN